MNSPKLSVKSSPKLSVYFNEVYSKFEKAHLPAKSHLSLAGYSVELSGSSSQLETLFLASLAHLKTPLPLHADLSLRIWYADSEGINGLIPEPPFEDFNGVGFSEQSLEEGYAIYYQPAFHQVFLYSEELNLGLYWTLRPSTIPWWEVTFSFRIIFHWWTKNKALQLMHAGAVALDPSGGWLIAGPSGSGKSSTCLTLLQDGLLYLGDDYVLVKTDSQPAVFTVYQTAKLEPDNMEGRFPEFKHLIQNPETYQQEKAVFQIYEAFPDSYISSVPLKGILLPTVTGMFNSYFVPVSPGKAVLGIAPTTLRHLPHDRDHSYQRMKDLAQSVPVIQWCLGTDKADLLRSFLELNQDHP